MTLIAFLCTSILSPHPGCSVERIPLFVDVLPTTCVVKAQEVLAEKSVLWGPLAISRFGCERRRRDVGHG